MNFGRLRPLYVSLRIANNGLEKETDVDNYDPTARPDTPFYAMINETINSSVIPDASKYVVAVERMELSINGIPFYLASGEEIRVIERANPANYSITTLTQHAYSLSQLLTILNAKNYVNPITAANFTVVFSITKEGFISCTLKGGNTYNNIYFQFPRKLNNILGIYIEDQTTGTIATSQETRLDLGDNLQHIVLESNLQTESDLVGNVSAQVLTDFAVPSNYSNSLSYSVDDVLVKSGFTTNLRQKVIYTPQERRYLNLISSFAIQNIRIRAYYTNIDNDLILIELPLGGYFDIKLSFFEKS